MARVVFTPNLQRHIECEPQDAQGATIREVLDAVFASNDRARSYVLDDQNALRKHMVIFNNGVQVQDRSRLSDPVEPNAEIFVLQALSGG